MQVRLFIKDSITFPFVLNAEQTHYCMHVLRLNEGDFVYIFNNEDGEFKTIIEHIHKKGITLDIFEKVKSPIHVKRCCLAFAPIKQDRLNFMIEKATELGVTDFYPIITEHTQVHKLNADRLLKIAIEAVEQSERLDVPTIHPTFKLRDFIQWIKTTSLRFACALERTEGHELKDTIDGLLVGPEGGFSESEKKLLAQTFIPLSLGNTILRAETAAIVGIDRIRT